MSDTPEWLADQVAEHQRRQRRRQADRAQFQQNRDRGLDARNAEKVRRMPIVELATLLKDAMNWRRLVDWEKSQQAAWTYESELQQARRIVSVEFCAAPDCGDSVDLVHPLPRWMIALLPDLSWVRCEMDREAA